MSALALTASISALIPGLTSSFLATGGTGPYVYSVRPNGAGGTINSSTGLYTAPAVMGPTPETLYDVVQVKDNVGSIKTSSILVGNPLLLFCEIIQRELGLSSQRVYLWDQKIFQPTDSGLYVAISVPSCKPFGNIIEFDGSGSGMASNQFLCMMATIDIDIISRGPEARDQKELVLMALNSVYSEQQQEINSFSIGKLPAGARFINLSMIDGAAIPYRYKISVNMQYTVGKTKAVPYYSDFSAGVRETVNA